MKKGLSRRELLFQGLAVAGAAAVSPMTCNPSLKAAQADRAPVLPVSVQRCDSYEPAEFRRALARAFDQIGGIGGLVSGKTVTVKINLTGMTWDPVDGIPARECYQTQPDSLAVLCALLAEAGARRIVAVETLYWKDSFEAILDRAGWDVKGIQAAGDHRVTFEDIRNRGSWKGYSRFRVPWGGFIFPAFDLNQRFEKTDVLVSLAKMKQHACAGITGAVKNFFGNTPCSLYGNDSPSEEALLHRTSIFHNGEKQAEGGAPAELSHGFARHQFVRVPRITADIFGARPADLCIVDGVRTIRGGEGHWNAGVSVLEPKLLVAGRNGVCTDSVCTALMGYDPKAPSATHPFPGDNHLELLASTGIGSNDLGRIEVAGLPIEKARFPFDRFRSGVG